MVKIDGKEVVLSGSVIADTSQEVGLFYDDVEYRLTFDSEEGPKVRARSEGKVMMITLSRFLHSGGQAVTIEAGKSDGVDLSLTLAGVSFDQEGPFRLHYTLVKG